MGNKSLPGYTYKVVKRHCGNLVTRLWQICFNLVTTLHSFKIQGCNKVRHCGNLVIAVWVGLNVILLHFLLSSMTVMPSRRM